MTRWIRTYYDEDDTWSYFELDDEKWAVRQMDLRGPDRHPVTAASLSEVLANRNHGGLTAVARYELRYGVLAEGSLDGWQEAQCAAEISAGEFERLWTAARKYLDMAARAVDGQEES
ncbi:hypothetical protein ACFYRC_34340 [Streptomyces sp. NPDC005279]|uniref:hypothetical protein n=1 Tax=Streptomyces sp. NPDC005279 TaxID=3364712 RepID=UPI00368196F9